MWKTLAVAVVALSAACSRADVAGPSDIAQDAAYGAVVVDSQKGFDAGCSYAFAVEYNGAHAGCVWLTAVTKPPVSKWSQLSGPFQLTLTKLTKHTIQACGGWGNYGVILKAGVGCGTLHFTIHG